ncbi:hypothetical protein GMST_26470 [Geomonas silvestris]|uniref:Polysaccharide pyruvyl transferase domain-containing protein n=1 Tax=Geomonas silvestris TaxID=2740184 RepID=A0A6V8MK39_9BACT|nr:polysaccharide pyruvyl transferase family protein [Geomonas silvestris]GFO60322.1 hypothetical protein GMST_26470 [Geomonas silvestris]
MTTYLIAGYYGMKNTGDDALQSVSCWGARNFLQAGRLWTTATTVPIELWRASVRPIFKPAPVFPGRNRLSCYLRALQSKGIIMGGGSVFHSCHYMSLVSDLLRLSGKGPHAALGVSIGPFRSSQAERDCAKLLRRFHFLGLRDKESADLARALAPQVPSALTFDLAPLLTLAAPQTDRTDLAPTRRSGIGFALCDYERFVGGNLEVEKRRRGELLRLVRLVAGHGEEIVLFEFNGHDNFGDRCLNEALLNELSGISSVRLVRYHPDPQVILREISKLKAMVAMRLHAGVFGYLTQTPTVMLSYNPKCAGWSEQIGADPSTLFDSADFDAAEVIQILDRAVAGVVPLPALPVKRAQELALKNWSWVHDR